MASTLQQASFGPFTGIVQEANASVNLTGKFRSAKGVQFSGMGKLTVRPGTRVVLTLKDDAAHATVTTVCALVPFADGALAVAHSTVTSKVYLYRLNSTLDGWTDSAGVAQTTLVPQPVGVLWTAMAAAPDVTIAEGLGVAYIAHAAALDGTSLVAATKTFTDSTRAIATLQSDLDLSTVAEDLYFRGVIAFQQHLWGWGFGSGTVVGTAYRPEVARFSQPIFAQVPAATGIFMGGTDSLTLGNRVRSQREQIVGAGVAGNALFLGAPFMLTRVTGYGRDSWFKEPVDQSHGFVGPKCMVTVGDTLYYWSSRGPMRIRETGPAEPLWDAVSLTAGLVTNPQKIVAAYDEERDIVSFTYDVGSGVLSWIGWDVRRDVPCVADDSWGQAIWNAGSVTPVYQSTAAATVGPLGAPTSAVTSGVSSGSAQALWTAGDPLAVTQVELRVQGGSTYTVLTSALSASVATYALTGLSANTAYEWRAAHIKDGITSAYLGPVAGSQFTTLGTGSLIAPANLTFGATGYSGEALATWTNAESGSTEVYLAGPSVGAPADADYYLEAVKGYSVASHAITVSETGRYWCKVRHLVSGDVSAFTGPVSDIIIVSP